MPNSRLLQSCALLTGLFVMGLAAFGQIGKTNRVEDLLAVLNTKDRSSILAYIKEHFATNVPPEERIERVMGVVNDAGPFKLVRTLASSPEEERYIIQDANGEQPTLTVKIGSDHRISALMLRFGGPGSGPDAKPPKDYRGWERLDDLAERLLQDTGCPAIGIALARDGKSEAVVRGIREQGKEALVGTNDPWSIGSIGKPLCSTMLATLIEEGKLSWTSTLGELLPDLAANTPYASVTVEQVMRHRGGIPRVMGLRLPEVKRIVGEAKTPGDMRVNFIKDVLSQPPIGKPGERFAYSNAGYSLLALIAERISGIPYEDLLRTRVFKPLAMSHSFIGSSTWPANRPMGHVPGPNGLEPTEMSGPLESLMAGAGGGIYMSVGDLARFGQEHLNGLKGQDGLLKAKTVQHLHSLDKNQPGEWYACGWGIENHPGVRKFHGHNGSNGTFRAQLAVFPESNLVVACIVNCGGESDPSPPLQAVLAVAQKFAAQ